MMKLTVALRNFAKAPKKVFATYDRINTFPTLVKICTPGSEKMLVINETSLNQFYLSVLLSHDKPN